MFCILQACFNGRRSSLQSVNEEDGDAGLPCATARSHYLGLLPLEKIQIRKWYFFTLGLNDLA